jgi:anthranilate phosphoribosyltransferase
VLEALGVDIDLSPAVAARVLATTGITFLFAPTYHPAMRHVAPVRKELGVPTIMNMLGPLANPAGVLRQVVGVSDRARAELIASALRVLGTTHALVVHGSVGMDEISPFGSTLVWEVANGEVLTWELDPAAYGLDCSDLDGVAGGDPAENAELLERLLEGEGSGVARCAVLLNAAAALYVSANDWSFEDAASRATVSLDTGAAAGVLDKLRTAAPRG